MKPAITVNFNLYLFIPLLIMQRTSPPYPLIPDYFPGP